MAVRITCIRKSNGNHQNPHEAITEFGWINEQTRATGKNTRTDMVHFIEVQKGACYVKDQFGNTANVGVFISSSGLKYLRTYADSRWTNNLLSLPEC